MTSFRRIICRIRDPLNLWNEDIDHMKFYGSKKGEY